MELEEDDLGNLFILERAQLCALYRQLASRHIVDVSGIGLRKRGCMLLPARVEPTELVISTSS